MTFSIKLLNENAPTIEYEELAIKGLITIGDFQESLIIPISFWKAEDYKKQWRESARIIASGVALTSSFITAMYDPRYATYIMCWPMYRVQDTIYIQNHILFLNTLNVPFDPMKPYQFIKERTIIDEDGNKLSEWSVSIRDIEAFLLELI